MSDATTTVESLKEAVRRFADARDWGQFHSPKNLVMALAIETAELMEHFLWMDGDASRQVTQEATRRQAVADELADVANLVFNLSHVLQIDLSQAIADKMVRNEQKYPVERFRGRSS